MLVVRYDDALLREPVWQADDTDPARPYLHRALVYMDHTADALYGQLAMMELAYWEDPGQGWTYRVTVWVSDGTGDGGGAKAVLPDRDKCTSRAAVQAQAAYRMRQWLMLPTLNGVDWLSPPLQGEHLPVKLPPAQKQDLEWLRRRMVSSDEQLIADAVALYQALAEQHARGNELYLRKRTECGHDEYTRFQYVVGDPTRWKRGGSSAQH